VAHWKCFKGNLAFTIFKKNFILSFLAITDILDWNPPVALKKIPFSVPIFDTAE
jgi:hypothetical protein